MCQVIVSIGIIKNGARGPGPPNKEQNWVYKVFLSFGQKGPKWVFWGVWSFVFQEITSINSKFWSTGAELLWPPNLRLLWFIQSLDYLPSFLYLLRLKYLNLTVSMSMPEWFILTVKLCVASFIPNPSLVRKLSGRKLRVLRERNFLQTFNWN